jgi:hypothetical protein
MGAAKTQPHSYTVKLNHVTLLLRIKWYYTHTDCQAELLQQLPLTCIEMK